MTDQELVELLERAQKIASDANCRQMTYVTAVPAVFDVLVRQAWAEKVRCSTGTPVRP